MQFPGSESKEISYLLIFLLLLFAIFVVVVVIRYINSGGNTINIKTSKDVPRQRPINGSSNNNTPRTIYFAGPLFSFQEVVGNDLLSKAIQDLSQGRYQIVEPQKLSNEEQHDDVQTIRAADLNKLLSADGILANFNGTDIDSGTVVEFVTAKMLNKPAVVLRTDFRSYVGNTVNLNPMLTGYPRTTYLTRDVLGQYQKSNFDIQSVTTQLAKDVIIALDTQFSNAGAVTNITQNDVRVASGI